jgi:hypothetical protein
MKYQVYRIDTFDAKSNGYSVGIREENWCAKFDTVFDSLTDAKEYVIKKNRQRSDLTLYLINLSESEKVDFINRFCFSDEPIWVCKRRYFLDKVNKDLVFKGLRNDGVRIVN